ncbi:hypothetical protein F444_17512 [Phytophthora nicotianae P1976]|uniref:Uncharacterized protein n=1 Tax=Phytophthora nicotianae P1976 TaxID=1317066 RepID=A0A080ZES2_PHYNI|nr:hypothetical protein F444_17512 [Phytophthora nicotianae P1976]
MSFIETIETKSNDSISDCNSEELDTLLSEISRPKSKAAMDSGELVKGSNEFVKGFNGLVKGSSGLVKGFSGLVKGPNELVNSPIALTVRERCADDKSSYQETNSSSNDCTIPFKIVNSTKRKGRPKIRKKQQREAKRIRMELSTRQANALVQGTLVPVKNLSLVRTTLECSFNVTDALPVLHSITEVDASAWKSTRIVQIAREKKVLRQVAIVFRKTILRNVSLE